jgi:alpha-mannosidase
VTLEVLKQAEDGDDLIVRRRGTCQKATRATIYLSGWSRKIEADFAPCEIKTFRVPTDESLPVIETNLLEREEPEQ